MKVSFIIVAILISISLSSCKKEMEQEQRRIMQAKVNGIMVICDSTAFVYREIGGKIIGFKGYKKGPVSFELSCPASVGTYQVLSTYDGISCGGSYKIGHLVGTNYTNQYVSKSGSITITSVTSSNIKGNFNFLSVNYPPSDTLEITEGIIDINY